MMLPTASARYVQTTATDLLPSTTTSFLQPLDVNYFSTLKRRITTEWAVMMDEETYEIKQKHLRQDNVIREDVIDKLRWLSCEFIKKYIKEQLLEEKENV